MTLQWQDELEAKFGLTFTIIDRERLAEMRRLRGFGVGVTAATVAGVASPGAGVASTAFGSSVVSMSALTTSAASTTPVPTTRSPRAIRVV